MITHTHLRTLTIAGLSLLHAACSTTLIVGDEEPSLVDGSGGSSSATGGSSNVTGGAASAIGGSGGEASCAAQDAALLAELEARHAPNDFNGLEGQWSGAAHSGSGVTLNLAANGSGTLRFGDAGVTFPPATDPNAGSYCDEDEPYQCIGSAPWVNGFEYTVHAATFDEGILAFTIETFEPWASLCALQTPHLWSDWGDCYYRPYENGLTGIDNDRCVLGQGANGESLYVDCDWWQLVVEEGVCDCTSTECFPAQDGRNGSGNGASQPNAGVYRANLVVSTSNESIAGWLGDDEQLVLQR